MVLMFTLGFALISCEKDKSEKRYASVNVVNASIGAELLKVNSYGRPISWSGLTGADATVNFAGNNHFVLFGEQSYPLTIVSASDTSNVIFNEVISNEDSMYTLFTTGQLPNFESLLIKETTIPYGLKDSVISVRFINLSPNGPSVNITLANQSTVNRVTNLGYKQYSEFSNYPSLKVIPTGSLTFQVRDSTSGNLLTSYTLPASAVSPYTTSTVNRSRFNSITLVIKGLPGITVGSNAYSIFPVPHYQ